MSKFKKGDRVRNLQKDEQYIPFNATGTVDEDNNMVPYVIWDEVTEFAKSEYPEKTRFIQNESRLELITQTNTNDPLGIIGKKMKGFKFEDAVYSELNYAHVMDNYIGSIGEIISYHIKYDSYRCQFGEDRDFHYPAELIKDYLVDTPQELTLLEKFEQGWEIKEIYNGFKIIDIAKSIKGIYFVEWSDGKIEQYDDLILNAVTCTPPKERKTLYVYEGLEQGVFASTEKYLYPIITTIHLEKNGDKWEVVKP